MISFLSIKNFAIVEDAEISFNKGLNVMTGESGSGKSIIVEAMSPALGNNRQWQEFMQNKWRNCQFESVTSTCM